ncbi:MAG: acyl carrier protein [Firmicutes bacterium]|nr:acyl carrier protein [Bacillota bacterium]MBQ2059517.1 acyl carrier protein [Bacillota bacterium]MBQ4371656.1 acyl carrier protein [Bacillota bacterium]
MEELLEFLEGLNDSIDFETADDLVDGKRISSLDILAIISFIDDEYDIAVPAVEIVPKNFNSAQAIWDMIERLEEE